MTINGYTTNDQTALMHSNTSDPWFHFYWPYPGEQSGYSWWPYDDRNNPNLIGGGGPSPTPAPTQLPNPATIVSTPLLPRVTSDPDPVSSPQPGQSHDPGPGPLDFLSQIDPAYLAVGGLLILWWMFKK